MGKCYVEMASIQCLCRPVCTVKYVCVGGGGDLHVAVLIHKVLAHVYGNLYHSQVYFIKGLV